MRKLLALITILALLLPACGDDDAAGDITTTSTSAATVVTTTTTTIPEPQTTTTAPDTMTQGCGTLHEPGEYEGSGAYQDVDQPYWIVVPEGYSGSAPAPLYVHLASGGGDHDSFMEGWRPYMEQLPGLMLMVNTAGTERGQPDALMSLIDQVATEYCIDPRQVHVLGTSSAFGEAVGFTCAYSDRIASFVAALGAGGGNCVPDRPVPLLSFTGFADRGGVRSLVERWAEINGCDPDPVVEDLGSGVFRNTFTNCQADVVYYDIETMGHVWPVHEAKGPGAVYLAEYEEVDYLEEAYSFFAQHPLP